MSNLQTYADIKSALADWLNRQDLTARIPDFITLAEADMRRTIQHDQGLCERATVTITDGSVSLPDDCHAILSIKSSAGTLNFTPMDRFDTYAQAQGVPTEYTLIGGQVYVYPQPTDGSTVQLTYRIKIDILRYGPNWLLENHPDAYIYGPLVHAAPYLIEDERLPLWQDRYDRIKEQIRQDGIRQSTGGSLQLSSNGPRW